MFWFSPASLIPPLGGRGRVKKAFGLLVLLGSYITVVHLQPINVVVSDDPYEEI